MDRFPRINWADTNSLLTEKLMRRQLIFTVGLFVISVVLAGSEVVGQGPFGPFGPSGPGGQTGPFGPTGPNFPGGSGIPRPPGFPSDPNFPTGPSFPTGPRFGPPPGFPGSIPTPSIPNIPTPNIPTPAVPDVTFPGNPNFNPANPVANPNPAPSTFPGSVPAGSAIPSMPSIQPGFQTGPNNVYNESYSTNQTDPSTFTPPAPSNQVVQQAQKNLGWGFLIIGLVCTGLFMLLAVGIIVTIMVISKSRRRVAHYPAKSW